MDMQQQRKRINQLITASISLCLHFNLGYGMTLGFPTIVIPAIKGGDGRAVDQQFSLTDEQISWFSMCCALGKKKKCNQIQYSVQSIPM